MAFDPSTYTRRSRGFQFDNVNKKFKIAGGVASGADDASEFAGTDNNNFGSIVGAAASTKEDLGLVTASVSAELDLGGLTGEDITASELTLPSYTVSTVPTASASTAQIIFVSDETGGATLAYSDGTNWRRLQDLAIISA